MKSEQNDFSRIARAWAVREGCTAEWLEGVFGWAWHCACDDNRHGCDQQCSTIIPPDDVPRLRLVP